MDPTFLDKAILVLAESGPRTEVSYIRGVPQLPETEDSDTWASRVAESARALTAARDRMIEQAGSGIAEGRGPRTVSVGNDLSDANEPTQNRCGTGERGPRVGRVLPAAGVESRPEPQVASADREIGWLVEVPAGRGGQPTWLATNPHCGKWTTDSNSAIRFRSRDEAQAIIVLCRLGGECVATEHVWIGPVAKPAQPPAAQVSDEELAKGMRQAFESKSYTPLAHDRWLAAARRVRSLLLGAQVKP